MLISLHFRYFQTLNALKVQPKTFQAEKLFSKLHSPLFRWAERNTIAGNLSFTAKLKQI